MAENGLANTKRKRAFALTAAVITWLAIVLQFVLIINNRKLSLAATIVQFFSYFTILTNLLVAFSLTASLLRKKARLTFLSLPAEQTAIVGYISIVGIVYNLVLRQLWNPEGLQLLADNLLHAAVPVLFITYWFLYVPKNNLQWKFSVRWLGYPFFYLLYILFRGAFTGLYPYPFIDVKQLGYPPVLLNCLVLFVAFLFVSILFIGTGKLFNKTAAE